MTIREAFEKGLSIGVFINKLKDDLDTKELSEEEREQYINELDDMSQEIQDFRIANGGTEKDYKVGIIRKMKYIKKS